MDPLVFGLIAASSLLHVAWNAVLKTAGDPFRTAAIGLGAAGLVIVPAAAAGWWAIGRPAIPGEVLWLAVVSGAVEAVYFVLLANGYRRGDLSVVYPVARGSATLFAVAVGVVILGERLSPIGWLGVAGLVSGLFWLRSPLPILRAALGGGRAVRARVAAPTAVGFAVLTGVAIATYSAIDRVAVRLVEPWLYAGLLWAPMAVFLLGLAWLATRSRRVERVVSDPAAGPLDVRRAVAGGLVTLVAYLLVLGALSLAPLTAVAPLRESAVVLAAAWGAVGLRETSGSRAAAVRIAASGLVVGGAILLALDG